MTYFSAGFLNVFKVKSQENKKLNFQDKVLQ